VVKIKNILSVDIEEVFHGEYTRQYYNSDVKYRTPENVQIVLDLLSTYNVEATFFVLGEIAEKFPEVVEMIKEYGHEISFHGWSHTPLWKLNEELFKEEIERFKRIYPGCKGYRAPSFSLNNSTKWALKILKEKKFCYDSSIFPVWTPLYGVYSAPQKPYRPSLDDLSKEADENYGIIEFPLTVYNLLGIKIPIAGGFWLRFWDIKIIEKGIVSLNRKEVPAVVYVHNWELDPETPRLKLNLYGSFVTYFNIRKTLKRLKRLLQKFEFTNFDEYLGNLDDWYE